MKRTLLLLFLLCTVSLVLQSCAEDNGKVSIKDKGTGDGSGDEDSGTPPSGTTLSWSFVYETDLRDKQAYTSSEPAIEALGTSIFVSWTEEKAADDHNVRVVKWDENATAWSIADGSGDGVYQQDSNRDVFSSNLEVYNGELFISWVEDATANPNPYQIRIAMYSAPNTWELKDGDKANEGINYVYAENAGKPVLAASSSRLYAIWNEGNQIRVKSHQNPDTAIDNWQNADSGGLNKSPTEAAEISDIVEFNGTMFAAFDETVTPGKKQIHVSQKTGDTTWQWVDGDTTSDSINFDKSKDASNPLLYVFDSDLYCAWTEVDAGGNTTIRIAQWGNGTTWNFIDGNDANGLRKDNSQAAKSPELVEFNSKLYAIWSEHNGTADQIRVARWDGDQSWSFVDGNDTDGLNLDTLNDASDPEAVVMNSKLYITWAENNKIHVLKGALD